MAGRRERHGFARWAGLHVAAAAAGLAAVLLARPAAAQPSPTATGTPPETPTSTPLPYCFDVGNPASPNFERYLYGASGRFNGTIIPEGSPGANYWRSNFPNDGYCFNDGYVEFNDAGTRPQY